MFNQGMIQHCMELCTLCKEICEETLFNHSLRRGGEHLDADNIRILAECIQICGVSADFLRRQSPYHIYTCRACAEICRACAESCENMGSRHATLRHCAEACRRCAISCMHMSQESKAA